MVLLRFKGAGSFFNFSIPRKYALFVFTHILMNLKFSFDHFFITDILYTGHF